MADRFGVEDRRSRGRLGRPWAALMVASFALIVLAGCGRVDLEDLTPEAFKTQQAGRPQATANVGTAPTAAAGETAATGGGAFPGADLAGGKSLYNNWCTGCHDSGRATPLKGKQYDFSAIEGPMRTGTGFSAPHPKYTEIEITNDQFTDILAFILSQPAP